MRTPTAVFLFGLEPIAAAPTQGGAGVNRPRSSAGPAGIMLFLVGIVLIASLSACSQSDNGANQSAGASSPARLVPTRGIPEDPASILKAADIGKAFDASCVLSSAQAVEATGVKSDFMCGTFTVGVLEVKGQEAASTWQRVNSDNAHPKAPQIAPDALFTPGVIAAVYKGNEREGVYVGVSFTASEGTVPKDSSALENLGKLAASRI